MEVALVEKAHSIHKEIEDLKRYQKIRSKNKKSFHFEVLPHYGSPINGEAIKISRKHNNLFVEVIDVIILDLEKQLKNL